MDSDQDWKQHKLKNLQRLRGSTFTFADYVAPSTEWDHDHCEGCWAKFAQSEEPESLHNGYFTIPQIGDENMNESAMIKQARESGSRVFAKPDAKRWICPECFNEFRAALVFTLKSSIQA